MSETLAKRLEAIATTYAEYYFAPAGEVDECPILREHLDVLHNAAGELVALRQRCEEAEGERDRYRTALEAIRDDMCSRYLSDMEPWQADTEYAEVARRALTPTERREP